MSWAIAASVLALGGCQVGPQEMAQQCGVDQEQLDAGFRSVNQLRVGHSLNVGQCTLKKVAGSQRVIVVVTRKSGLFTPGQG